MHEHSFGSGGILTPTSTRFDGARSHRAAIESRLSTYLGIDDMFEIESPSARHQWRVLIDPAGHPFCITILIPEPT